MHGLHVVVIHFTAYDLYQLRHCLQLYILHLYLVHLVDDALVVWCQHLCAVFPIGLVAVVLLGIVAGGNVYAGLCMQVTDGEGHFGSGSEALKEIHLDAVGAEDGSHCLGKETAVVAAVMAYHYAQLLAFGEGFEQVVGKSLCGHTHDVFVHAVGASAHDATQSASTELQVLVESVYQSGLVLILHHLADFCLCLFVVVGRGEPGLCLCFTLLDQL